MANAILDLADAIVVLKTKLRKAETEHVMERVNSGEYLVSFNADEDLWEVRGNYQTLLTIDKADGAVWVSDQILEEVPLP